MVDGVDGVTGVDGADSGSESEEGDTARPSMPRRPQPDGDSAGQGQSFSESLDNSIDPSILPDGDVGMMDLQSPTHPQMNSMQFPSSAQFDLHDRRGSTQSRRGPPMQDSTQSNVLGAGGQQEWERQTQDVDGEPLPWPGNLAAVYKDQNPPGGGDGFNAQNRQGWSDQDPQNRDFRS
jgi:hypothetical protein